MLEGIEVEKKLGNSGSVILDVNGQGIAVAQASWVEGGVSASLSVEVDVIMILEALVAKTDNQIDNGILAMVKGALGRK